MKLLREPLVHFLALGGLLFGGFAIANQRPERRAATHRIIVSPFVVANLVAGFQQTAGRPPETGEKQTLIADHVREEILVREARALGLDRDDPVVRGQLRLRMERLAADRISAKLPSDRELAEFLIAHANEFKTAAGLNPPLAEIRDTVRPSWERARRQAAIDADYQTRRSRYEVVIEQPPRPGSASP